MVIDPSAFLKARRARGLTQEQLAYAADVARATVQNIESGRNNPTRVVVRALADVLGVDVDQITTHGDPRSAEVGQVPPHTQGTAAHSESEAGAAA